MVQAHGSLDAIATLTAGPAGPVVFLAALLEQPRVIQTQPIVAFGVHTVLIQENYFAASDDCRFSRAGPELSHEQLEVAAAQLHQLLVWSLFGDYSFLKKVYTVNVAYGR